MRAELLGDRGEHTGLIGHLELQVELALDLVDGQLATPFSPAEGDPPV